MTDDALISLWFFWKSCFFWSMVTLLAIGGVYAASLLIHLRLPFHMLVLRWFFKLAVWVPIIGTSISLFLMEWIDRRIFEI